MGKLILFLFCFMCSVNCLHSQLTANAGNNQNVCPNNNTMIGGSPSASGGTPPYTYNWQPADFLNNSSASNPLSSNINGSIEYTLTVTDNAGNSASSTVSLFLNLINTYNAGRDTGYCFGQQTDVKIGATNNNNANHVFSWQPTLGLDDPTATNPLASPTVTTVYQLTVSDGFCPSHITQVTVTPYSPPTTDAGIDTTINEGSVYTLHGTGGTKYWWIPDYNIKYRVTANPDVWPITSTTYTLYLEDAHGCSNADTVRVNVINGNILFFYNAFTPNGDGDNDVFYIGNIEKYPDNNLKIYNRYGKTIYSATSYLNDWDGKYLGDDVPTGVYFYILNDGIDKQYKGTVTILR